jgi:hypothetical protein
MFNQFSITILERLVGKKFAVLLDELSGTTERTWRNRFKHGWEPTEDERKSLDERMTAAITEKMNRVGEWSLDEARKILAERPSNRAGIFLPTADLIYQFSPLHGDYCPEAVALATRFDRDCKMLAEAVRSGEVDGVREVLIAMLDWLRTFCPDETQAEDALALQSQFETSADVGTLLQAAKPMAEALIFHVLSCWDIEFCAGYFEGSVQAYPLFELVMPRFAPDIEIEQETGRLLRDGRQPRKKVFETATSRLLDFLSVLVAWRRYRRLPDSVPRVKDFAAWSRQNEARVVSWRDETTRFTTHQLEQLWTNALTPDGNGFYPAIPSPMFVCAHLWSPLLIRDEGRATHLVDCAASYRSWWERHRDRLVAKGLQFGDQALPDFLTAEGIGKSSLASVFVSQSAGRSSHPRDCQ